MIFQDVFNNILEMTCGFVTGAFTYSDISLKQFIRQSAFDFPEMPCPMHWTANEQFLYVRPFRFLQNNFDQNERRPPNVKDTPRAILMKSYRGFSYDGDTESISPTSTEEQSGQTIGTN